MTPPAIPALAQQIVQALDDAGAFYRGGDIETSIPLVEAVLRTAGSVPSEQLRKLLVEFKNDAGLARIGHYGMSGDAVLLYIQQIEAVLAAASAWGVRASPMEKE